MSKLGVVLVSHSADIAKGLKDIVDEMNDGSVTVMAAGGADEGRIGTSAVKIMEAMEALADNDYILVYADLGSSIMSAETAVEMLEEEVADKIRMVDCPIVEGALAGVVEGGVSGDLDSVIKASEAAREVRKFE